MKAQENPSARTGDQLERWTAKNATRALAQAQGALKTISRQPFWCQHSRRGRVDFAASSITVTHAVVITELLGEVVELSDDVPLSIRDTPVTFMSVNDFCNIIIELRTLPDITDYLSARDAILPARTRRTIGAEIALYQYYVLNQDSFVGCCGYEDARIVAAARKADFEKYLRLKPEKHSYASIVECVADRLAERLENYAEGLDARTIADFDDPTNRRQYLLIQNELCNLRRFERDGLGMQFMHLMAKVKNNPESECMAYGAYYADQKPDFVYVLLCSKGIDRLTVIERTEILLRAGLAAYNKTSGMAIADRDGQNFEVRLVSQYSPGLVDKTLGEQYFARLKITDIDKPTY